MEDLKFLTGRGGSPRATINQYTYHLDSYLVSGPQHARCQDAVLTNTLGPLLAVSDGCSTGNNTDLGAMVLLEAIRTSSWCNSRPINEAWRIAENSLKYLMDGNAQRVLDSLTATLLLATVIDDCWEVSLVGDGFIGYRDREEKFWTWIVVDWEQNAPYYLRYFYEQNSDKWLKEFPNNKYTVTTYKSLTPDKWDIISKYQFTPDAVSLLESPCTYTITVPLDKSDLLVLSSDGLMSLYGKDQVASVFAAFHEFKLLSGPFLQRRLGTYISHLKKSGVLPGDDLGVSAAYWLPKVVD